MRLQFRHLFPAFLFLCLLLSSIAYAQQRGVKRVEIKTAAGELVGLYEESHALVIGVSDYTAGWPDLESVTKDVQEVSAALEGQGFNVVRVLNPTKLKLVAAFSNFIDQYGYDPDNRLLFYYSGHGYTQELHGRPVGYLVPSDAPNPNEDRKGFSRRSLRMTQILSWSKQIEAKHALFLFDSCFSGSVLKERALVVPQQIRRATSKPVRQFISAGSAGQTVPADSIFRPSFIRGIRGEADLDKDGYVTGTELGLFLQKRVASYDTGQTPQFGKIKDPIYDEGDFVFALPKVVTEPESTAAAPAPATVAAPAPSQFLPDEEMWKELQDSDSPEDFEDFLAAFPESKLAPVARMKLKRLKRKQSKAKAEQQQLAEEAKHLEEERKRLEAEKQQISEAKRKTEEEQKRKQEEERKRQLVEEAKREEERKRQEAEQRRIAEAKRKAEEELAALRQKQEQPKGVWTEPVTGMRFVEVPGGSFEIGDQFGEGEGNEWNNRKITIKSFRLGATEVTQKEWQKIMGSNPSKLFRGSDLPVERVSFNDVQEFIRRLNARTGKRFRLPTEAEWEYACREGGRKVRYCNGKDEARTSEIHYNSGETKRVASFAPNSLGLYDMSGNVLEWTCSEYKKRYDGREEKCAVYASNYSLRGGSWDDDQGWVRAATRYSFGPDFRHFDLGFRLAQD